MPNGGVIAWTDAVYLVAVAVSTASEPFPSVCGLILKGEMAGNGEFDLRTRGGTREDMEASADSVRSFPHAGKPPMSIPAGLQDDGVDSRTIIPDRDTELSR